MTLVLSLALLPEVVLSIHRILDDAQETLLGVIAWSIAPRSYTFKVGTILVNISSTAPLTRCGVNVKETYKEQDD
jgi:hypothetical protein